MNRLFQSAWQPLTPRGVARFSEASLGRLLAVEVIFAVLAAVVVTWCVRAAWFPVAREAIQKLPERGEVRQGQLVWAEASPQRLAEGRFLSLAVDLEHTGGARGAADINVELGCTSVRVASLFGYLDFAYPKRGAFALNRPELVPWWGAWSPAILAAVLAGTGVVLLISWAALAVVYCVPVWLLGFFKNRALHLQGAWRLSGAAQMPGALVMTAAVFCYGLAVFDPTRLLVAFAMHFVVGWLYLAVSPLTLPSIHAPSQGNPFIEPGASSATPNPAPSRTQNPFGAAGP
jgi:hypothetical protein